MKNRIYVEQTCENCKFYSQHYAIKGNCLLALDKGCCHKKVATKSMTKSTDTCEHWQDNHNKTVEQEMAITDYIKSIHKKLNSIDLILRAKD